MKTKVLVFALAMIASVGFVSAQNGTGKKIQKQLKIYFVDANGDGICDNATVNTLALNACANFVDADGDGICDNCGRVPGSNFVDADGDGICDNAGSGKGKGTGLKDGSKTGRKLLDGSGKLKK